MSIVYTMVSPLKNIVQSREKITNFEEKEHGIYFIWQGTKQFVSWNVLASYNLVEDD